MVGMYIATIPNRNSPPAILIRESYRENGRVKTRTIANITSWSPERIEALRLCFKGKFDGIAPEEDPISDRIFGPLFVLKEIAQRLNIVRSLGNNQAAKLALFLILARVAHQGSRLSSVRWAADHAVAETLGITEFDEDDLYEALEWLATHQTRIEKQLFNSYVKKVGQPPVLVLYDVTSSYFEGDMNELSEYGYNRDGKKGKKQIVIGLLTADDGEPLAIRVFKGNTSDPTTVADQIEILKKQFNVHDVVFVGDRGMIKKNGKASLTDNDLKYITALTNPQVRKLLKKDIIQLNLFDTVVTEVSYGDLRLVLWKNDDVYRKEGHRRQDKINKFQRLVQERNEFVKQSKRANPEAGLRKLTEWTQRYKLSSFVDLFLDDNQICFTIDEEKKSDAALLDGCYVLETDVSKVDMNSKMIDERYRDLQKVERNFRNIKTALLEIRPIFVRKKERTIGHVFSAMLALKIGREINECLKSAFGTTDDGNHAITIQDALQALSRLCFYRTKVAGQEFLQLPKPDKKQAAIFEALKVKLPIYQR